MAQVRRARRGRGVPLWMASLGVALSCAAGAGAHALVADHGIEVSRQDEALAEQAEGMALEASSSGPDVEPPMVVHVDGAVAEPGVYDLPVGARAGDAVEAAGGLLDGADLTGVNLAAHVADGEKVHIPAEGEEPAASAIVSGTTAAAIQDGVVNINTADAAELATLPGVGEATAQAIIEDRERLGPFATPEDIMRVSGIGEKKYERMRDRIRVS